MAGTVAIIIAKDDFSIPGGGPGAVSDESGAPDPEAWFFTLLGERHPDVVVLDFSHQHARGLDVIAKIRARSETPILVVTPADGGGLPDFCAAGAADCIKAPVDIVLFSQVLQRVAATRRARLSIVPPPSTVSFAGISWREYGSRLTGPKGSAVRLTTSEARVLVHLLSKPLIVCSRGEIGEMLYGRYQPSSERAIDIIINRLRKKLTMVAGPSAQNLIKTEFRRGYTLLVERIERGTEIDDRDSETTGLIASSAA